MGQELQEAAGRLGLDAEKIARARECARRIAAPIHEYISIHTTISIERSTLRALGADGASGDGVPVPNLAVDSVKGELGKGAARYYVGALVETGWTVEEMNLKLASGYELSRAGVVDKAGVERKAGELTRAYCKRVKDNLAFRAKKISERSERENSPLLYVIVATGNVYEDAKQARAAALQEADVIAVIRSTAQSLLDYVPYGPTTEGFGGTYATQENFRVMRQALDEAGDEIGKYVRLVNYCSGLCMPEIAVMASLERLDMVLNDAMYGVLFRDINVYRTFVDQHFARMVNALSGEVINTGEDNYLTTSDALEAAHVVLASQFINERLALDAGLDHSLIGLGHAYEINPEIENSLLYELAQAQMARDIFPKSPLKYMPPTKHMTGDVFRGLVMNSMFNLVSKISGQSIHLLGMLTEAVHTPSMQDRFLAIDNARLVMKAASSLGDEIEYKKDGVIAKRAALVLDMAAEFLERVAESGLFAAIEEGLFADVKRKPDGGKGLEGVIEKADDYWNPIQDALESELFQADGKGGD